MGRPRRDSNKSDSGSTAGNVYNASLAAAQKVTETVGSMVNTTPASSTSIITPQLDAISLVSASEAEKEKSSPGSSASIANIISPVIPAVPAVPVVSALPEIPVAPTNIHRRSLSIAELVSLVSSRNSTTAGTGNTSTTPQLATSSTFQALRALNLPDALRSTLEKADSPILNALLPLIRQKLAAKTALNRRNSAVDPKGSVGSNEALDSTNSIDSLASRRSSTSSRSEDHRLSHKLAERKRRKEMKDVFDNLKDALPAGVPKSSKWEILNEASAVIDDLLEQEQNLLNQRNQLLKKINENSKN